MGGNWYGIIPMDLFCSPSEGKKSRDFENNLVKVIFSAWSSSAFQGRAPALSGREGQDTWI